MVYKRSFRITSRKYEFHASRSAWSLVLLDLLRLYNLPGNHSFLTDQMVQVFLHGDNTIVACDNPVLAEMAGKRLTSLTKVI